MKMADELDRVRISAAELRAKAMNVTTNEHSLKIEEATALPADVCQQSPSQRQWDGKRPDLQRYQPRTGQGRRCQDSVSHGSEGEAPGHSGLPGLPHKLSQEALEKEEVGEGFSGMMDVGTEVDTGSCHGVSRPKSPDGTLDNADCCSPNQANSRAAFPSSIAAESGRQEGADCGKRSGSVALKDANHCVEPDYPIDPCRGTSNTSAVESFSPCSSCLGSSTPDDRPLPSKQPDSVDPSAAVTSMSRSPRPARRIRKPDREIYQPGGRRLLQQQQQQQGSKDLGREPETVKEEMKKSVQPGKQNGEKEERPFGKKRDGGKEKEEKRGGKEEDRLRGKGGREDSKVSVAEKRKGKKDAVKVADDPAGAVDHLSGGVEKMRVSEARGEDAKPPGKKGGENELEEEGKRKRLGSKGTRNGGGEKSVDRGEVERHRGPKARDGAEPEEGKGKRRSGGKLENRERDEERPKQRGGERDRAQEGGGKLPPGSVGKAGAASKRYSKSDKRCSRHRTYSTSSASSGTSMDGPGEAGRRRGHFRLARQRGDEKAGSSGRDRVERGEGSSGQQQWKKETRTFSSTDSFEESETVREGRRRKLKERERYEEENYSPERRAVASAKSYRGGGGGKGGEGILRAPFDKCSDPSQPSLATSEDLHRRQEVGTRSRGRGILVLPAHTDLTTVPEPGPRLIGGGRGGPGLGRGRGGRGGGTRRLWDPNNPEQKPALARGSQSQRLPLQQPLHLHQQSGYSQLHFLDTDDEAAGSPPVHQGELFNNYQQTTVANSATMAYYKFQNSDNPYYFQSPNATARYPYPYHIPYQMPGSNGMYPSPANPFYVGYGQSPGSQGYPAGTPPLTPEEAEVQTRGELVKVLRAADSQELQLSNLLSRDKLSPEGLDRMGQLRAELLTLYERVILTDIEFSDSQNLDQALWKNVFYQVIERFRQLLKDSTADTESRIRTMLLTLLDEGVVFFDSLLQKLQTVFQFKLEDYMDGVAIRARPLRKTVKYALISAQRCMICQGDIARYREQASDSTNYGKARSWYLKAQHIAPKNGRPYNQLALLAVYTKRKLDAVYYYMRSLAASNPILTAKESLMSLFEETKRKADQLEQRQRKESDEGSRGPRGIGRRGEEASRVEIWVRPGGQVAAVSRTGSESSRESGQDGELGTLSASDLNKRFILSFLHAHGKLFTKVGMETFPAVASRVLQEFRALLQHSPSLLGSSRTLQIVTINMFAVHNAQSREGQDGVRSVLQEQTTALGLTMFSLLVQRCTELLVHTPTAHRSVDNGDCEEEEDTEGMVKVSAFPQDLRELLPSVKVWSDWMLGHPEQWNPPPCSLPLPSRSTPDVWQCLADLCNALANVYHGEAPLYKADGDGDEELRLLLLEEDRLLAGFVPLLAAPQEPCYTERSTDAAIAADCKRVTVLKYFLEALCGQEEPLLAFKGGKYVSMAAPPPPSLGTEAGSRQGKQADNQDDDVIVEARSSQSQSEGDLDGDGSGSEDDIRELRARRHVLVHKLALQQKRQDKIQAVLQMCRPLELEIRPLFLVPDTNGFIDHLAGLKSLLACGLYILVVPLIVVTELDGLARGQDNRGGSSAGGGAGGVPGSHARGLQERAKAAVSFLERGFEAREPCLRAMTSRGSQLESIAFRSEDTSGQQGNNDDLILSCCLHYCKDKAKDFMPSQRDEPVRLHREVVLLTDDRNLRVKALTRNVPVRDIPAFLKWTKVG